MTDIAKYGPWALIAGGSEGVGAEFAKRLAGDGFGLVLIARKPGPLQDTARQCREIGAQVRTLAIDLLDPDAVARITAQTTDIEVGLLIYNAGANTCSERFLDAELSDFGRVIDLNVTRMLQLVQHFGRPMRSRGRGGILVVGSMAATHGSMRQSVYTGVKAFSRLFAESLWLELREHGVDVLELVLGVTRTPAMARVGLKFDVPGLSVSEPVDVAREGLENLANGPVFIAGGNAAAVQRGSGPDRAAIVLGAHRTVQELLGQK
ncbi:SDR family NAD(P)-dependent oxidoreductase [Mycobacterium sp. WUMAC-067]|uniref:SDR family NAD(P)-dependent oxidoreductase n=1 Tax=unclassified Mycobacterium TaxID=2642494 RepID=UPI001CD9BE0C|nr:MULTISPECIES: SDR family NAD(P)-dependent oxidoreductase [unclassified Mycobacterium]MCA2244684.1 SDR family NAD(P)-dependent oxidoreductase [Mycobacterium sp. WUMAC-067]MCA2315575.1 SDR family NAD(P)-dependent oxidoreductase [Mycobacterium sp. WUMAC-025]